MKYTVTLIATTCLLFIFGCNNSNKVASNSLYTFVVAGDGRAAPKDTSITKNPSGSNLPFLKVLFNDMGTLDFRPAFLFYNGDLVYGFSKGASDPTSPNDTTRFKNELLAWIDIYKQSSLYKSGTKLIVVPGNHEIDSLTTDPKKEEVPMLAKEKIFVRIMSPFLVPNWNDASIKVNRGPTPATDSLDGLGSDQSLLTYSFDYNGDHFIIFNTDPFSVGNRVPWHWLVNDLAADASNHKNDPAHHIFLFGHKPPYGSQYYDKGQTSMDAQPADRDSAWKYIEQYGCDAYFGSHIHLWDAFQPTQFVPAGKSGTWEIVCGNAGAPRPDGMTWTPKYNNDQPYLGFTQVLLASDEIKINSYRMDTVAGSNDIILKTFKIKHP